ncbi:MAG: hypothetical protein LAO07_08545 [Acidobacteriia bacterium]|nr:hypothetical protein [Terriglobia bacterium]
MPQENSVSVCRLILVPALITLGITILRLVGELLGWPKPFFNAEPGGGAAIVGISWLPIIFGIYFALKLASAGDRPASLGKAAGFTFLGLVVYVGGGVLFGMSLTGGYGLLAAGAALIIAGTLIPLAGWSKLVKVLLAYGFAARIPVAVLMIFAIHGTWGTHYDGAPPNFPEMAWLSRWFLIGFIPQMTLWIGFTVIIGSLFGLAAVAIARRGKAPAPATS